MTLPINNIQLIVSVVDPPHPLHPLHPRPPAAKSAAPVASLRVNVSVDINVNVNINIDININGGGSRGEGAPPPRTCPLGRRPARLPAPRTLRPGSADTPVDLPSDPVPSWVLVRPRAHVRRWTGASPRADPRSPRTCAPGRPRHVLPPPADDPCGAAPRPGQQRRRPCGRPAGEGPRGDAA